MKKLFILIITVFLISCQEKPIVVPLLIYNMGDNYMSDFENRIQELNGTRVIYETYDCQNSQIIQNEYIEQLMKDNYPLLIINPVDRLSVYAIINKAIETNTKIIFINREPLKSDMQLDSDLYYIGADAKQSAELQAEIVMELFGNNPNQLNTFDKNDDGIIQAFILKGEQGHQDAEARTQYVIETLLDNDFEVDVLDITIANFDMLTAVLAMDQHIEKYGNQFEVVLANNDAMAIGAIESLINHEYFLDSNEDGIIDRDLEQWVPVIGIDGLDIAIEMIQNGYLYGTVLNDSQAMVEAIDALTVSLLINNSLNGFDYQITDGQYIWIDYQKLIFE
ncbi:MAG: galactose ABC transporter substrate-binding protein [Acholeplasmataceae bacterium]|nr:galactose ABC transporter substrate-binding protein [Acholeplasmataceae bacterium]